MVETQIDSTSEQLPQLETTKNTPERKEFQLDQELMGVGNKAEENFKTTEGLIRQAESLLPPEPEQEQKIAQETPRPNEYFIEDAMNMYGIDSLDQKSSTAKDKIFIELERLDQLLAKGGNDDEVVNDKIDSLIKAEGSGESVRLGDILATRDALSLRIQRLTDMGDTSPELDIMKRKQKLLGGYLDQQGQDISEDATAARLMTMSAASQKYHRNIDPKQLSAGFNRHATRAAWLETYGGKEARDDLHRTQELLAAYPQTTDEFQRSIVRESLYGISPEQTNIPVRLKTTSEQKLRNKKFLQGYEYEGLILSEVEYAQNEVRSLGVSGAIRTILLGSAAHRELRTTQEDPSDPSNIDMLVVAGEDDIKILERQMETGGVRLSRSRTASGATFYIMKRPSLSGKLGETEVMICSEKDLQKQNFGSAQEPQTEFVNKAFREGLTI